MTDTNQNLVTNDEFTECLRSKISQGVNHNDALSNCLDQLVGNQDMDDCISEKLNEGWDQDRAVAACSEMVGNMQHIQANISDNPRLEIFNKQDHVVVPLVMAKAGVEMNGSTIDKDELIPQSWNGSPVTLGHPEDKQGHFMSANSPRTLEEYGIGRVFNAEVDNEGKLKAEAWIDTNSIDKQTIEALNKRDSKIDVSTGYFAKTTDDAKHVDIKPDHLAILMNEEGACSWEDGCGVRANQKRGLKMHVNEAFNTIKRALGMKTNCDCETTANKEESTMADNEKTEQSEEVVEGSQPEANSNQAHEPQAQSPELQLNADDLEALKYARRVRDEHKQSLISKIMANSDIPESEIKEMDMKTLETVANGLRPVANYQGRPLAQQQVNDDSEVAEAMSTNKLAKALEAKQQTKH